MKQPTDDNSISLEKLTSLSKDALRVFSARCAIRALPLMGHQGYFDFWGMDAKQHVLAVYAAAWLAASGEIEKYPIDTSSSSDSDDEIEFSNKAYAIAKAASATANEKAAKAVAAAEDASRVYNTAKNEGDAELEKYAQAAADAASRASSAIDAASMAAKAVDSVAESLKSVIASKSEIKALAIVAEEAFSNAITAKSAADAAAHAASSYVDEITAIDELDAATIAHTVAAGAASAVALSASAAAEATADASAYSYATADTVSSVYNAYSEVTAYTDEAMNAACQADMAWLLDNQNAGSPSSSPQVLMNTSLWGRTGTPKNWQNVLENFSTACESIDGEFVCERYLLQMKGNTFDPANKLKIWEEWKQYFGVGKTTRKINIDQSGHLTIVTDSSSEKDYLDHQPLIISIFNMLAYDAYQGNTCIGLFGAPGVGKTTALNVLLKHIRQCERQFITHVFNVSSYARTDNISADLVQNVIDVLMLQGKQLGSLSLKRGDLNDVSIRKKKIAHAMKSALGKRKQFLLIVDGMDHCPSEVVVQVLETVNLMKLTNVTSIVAVDSGYVLSALSGHYKNYVYSRGSEIHGLVREYLGKVIQIPVTLNNPSIDTVRLFINKFLFSDCLNHIDTAQSKRKKTDSLFVADKKAVTETKKTSRHSISTLPEAVPKDFILELSSGEVLQDSVEEANEFFYLSEVYNIVNPRQLKRLYNCFRLLKSWNHKHSEKLEGDSRLWLQMLFALEYWAQLDPLQRKNLEEDDAGERKAPVPKTKGDAEREKRLKNMLFHESHRILRSRVECLVLPYI